MSQPTFHSSEEEEAWVAYLDKEYLLFEKGSVEHDMSSIIKQKFFSRGDHDNAVRSARHRHVLLG